MPRPPKAFYLEEPFMTRTIAFSFAVLGTLTASAQAQETVPNPTKADAAKVVTIISADKAKINSYCKLADMGDEIKKAIDARPSFPKFESYQAALSSLKDQV
jgi:hypothetical protein